MKHIIILGAGTGGMPAAYELKEKLGKAHKITVVNERPFFQFVPSNPWLAVGWRERSAITLDIASHLNKKDIDFIAQRCEKIDAQNNQMHLADGQILDYDYLIITTGPRLAFDLIEGSDPQDGNLQSICHIDHAEQAYAAFQKLIENPGPIVVGAMPGASCFGPAYEFSFILNTELRKRKMRHKVPMTYVTSEPYIGHLGLGGVGDSKSMLESELRDNDIKWITNAKVTKAAQGMIYADELNDAGEVIKQHELEHNFAMLLPAFRGVHAVAEVPDLCNPGGFVQIDEYQRSTAYNNIFSAGVCVAIPPVEVTPVPTGAPKTGYMIESMVTAIVHNITAEINGEPATAKGSWSAFCLADMGDTGAAFVAVPQIPPRNTNWYKKGKWAHWAKIAFEKYFLYKMKAGISEPIYEKYALKAIGLTRLDDNPSQE